jgi:3-phosphoshikimate 1-carboxyvinyltransferase
VKLRVEPSRLRGRVAIPASKSHTIRAVAIASLASGTSRILSPLESADTLAAVDTYRAAGADIKLAKDVWTVRGAGGEIKAPKGIVDVKNSGTTLNVALGSFALMRKGTATLTGDEQIQRRPSKQLAASLSELGASVKSLKDNGCAPFEVKGRLKGGETSLEAVSSQYLSSLLINTPLADGDSHILVPLLNEAPYVQMTLAWLAGEGIKLECKDDLSEFRVPGNQSYGPFEKRVPADFSSATFFLAAGALGGNSVTLDGLDMNDTQGDKAVVEYVQRLGARVSFAGGEIAVASDRLAGCEIDLNATPDALPMMAALACFAKGRTTLANVPQARIKETDRITVMAAELSRMGARVRELPDGLVIDESPLHGAEVDSHGDHRIVMALAVAATAAKGETVIHRAEAMAVTFPAFVESLARIGGKVRIED